MICYKKICECTEWWEKCDSFECMRTFMYCVHLCNGCVVIFPLSVFFLVFSTSSCPSSCLALKQEFQVLGKICALTAALLSDSSCGILHQSYLIIHNKNNRIMLPQLRLHHLSAQHNQPSTPCLKIIMLVHRLNHLITEFNSHWNW